MANCVASTSTSTGPARLAHDPRALQLRVVLQLGNDRVDQRDQIDALQDQCRGTGEQHHVGDHLVGPKRLRS